MTTTDKNTEAAAHALATANRMNGILAVDVDADLRDRMILAQLVWMDQDGDLFLDFRGIEWLDGPRDIEDLDRKLWPTQSVPTS